MHQKYSVMTAAGAVSHRHTMDLLWAARSEWEDLHNGIDPSAIALPHAPEPWLATNVPNLQWYRIHVIKRNCFNTELWQCKCIHTLMVTLPLLIFLMLKPTVGIMSSLNWPDWKRKLEKLFVNIESESYDLNFGLVYKVHREDRRWMNMTHMSLLCSEVTMICKPKWGSQCRKNKWKS